MVSSGSRLFARSIQPWLPTAVVLAVTATLHRGDGRHEGEATLSRGLRTAELLRPHATVGYWWQNTRLRLAYASATATDTTSCRKRTSVLRPGTAWMCWALTTSSSKASSSRLKIGFQWDRPPARCWLPSPFRSALPQTGRASFPASGFPGSSPARAGGCWGSCGDPHSAYLPASAPPTPAALRPARGFPAPRGRSRLRRLLWQLRCPGPRGREAVPLSDACDVRVCRRCPVRPLA
jgi:hypothetical protein